MSARILDGRVVSRQLIDAISRQISRRSEQGKTPPGLAVVLVGDDPASAVYVRNKRRACERAGIRARDYDLPDSTTEPELLDLIDELNADEEVHGILVQLPLPGHINEHEVTNRISVAKDVDGFHAFNVGRLALRQPGLRPCTPRGVMTLLNYYGIDPKGMDAVIVGASNIVGRPMTLELLLAGATVTCCHRFTENLEAHVRRAELLVVAVGKVDIVEADWIQPGCIVVDVGIHRSESGKLHGDVDFRTAREAASWITPVPGGVGPMTVATLLQNTAEAAGVLVESPVSESIRQAMTGQGTDIDSDATSGS